MNIEEEEAEEQEEKHRKELATDIEPKTEAWNVSFPHSPQKKPALPTPRFWTSGFQDCKTISLRYLSHLVCGTLL